MKRLLKILSLILAAFFLIIFLGSIILPYVIDLNKYKDIAVKELGRSLNREVSIEGVAATYSDLVSQLVLFEDSQYIEKFSMDEAEYESGSIRFKMDVVLAKSILEPITL